MTTCQVCGSINQPLAKWCAQCGAALPIAAPGSALPSPGGLAVASGSAGAYAPQLTQRVGNIGGSLRMPDGSEVFITGHMTIGRMPPCDILLNDLSVSREHAEINVLANGTVKLKSLADNRTVVGNTLLPRGGEMTLSPGAVIQLGTMQLMFNSGGPLRALPLKAEGDVCGLVMNARETTQELPLSGGLWLARASLAVFVITGAITLIVTTVIFAICSCGVAPVLLGMGYAGFRLLKDTVLGKRQVQQVAFTVQDPVHNNSAPVVLFRDQGGHAGLNDGDDVVVYGTNHNGTWWARRVEIRGQNGVPVQQNVKIKGKQPMPWWQGALWLLVSLSPLLLLAGVFWYLNQ